MSYGLFRRVIPLFFPSTCYHCAKLLKTSSFLCEECLSKIDWIGQPICTICGLPFVSSSLSHPCARCLAEPPLFDCHRSCVIYEEPVSSLLFRFKYNRRRSLSLLFGEWLWQSYSEMILAADYLIPVPLFTSRLVHRTFNQSLEVAKILSGKSGRPLYPELLVKIRKTPSQTGLDLAQRKVNLKGAFCLKTQRKDLEGKKVLLIDDVYSTGTTLSFCAGALRSLKPSVVEALTIAYNTGRNLAIDRTKLASSSSEIHLT